MFAFDREAWHLRAVGSTRGEDNTVGAGRLVVAVRRSVDLAVRHDRELRMRPVNRVRVMTKGKAYLVPRAVTTAVKRDVLRGLVVVLVRVVVCARESASPITCWSAAHADAPGKFPLCMSFTPALIAAVMADTLYLLLPQVTVPEGRARGRLAARAAEAESRTAERALKSMSVEVQGLNGVVLGRCVPLESRFISSRRRGQLLHLFSWLRAARRGRPAIRCTLARQNYSSKRPDRLRECASRRPAGRYVTFTTSIRMDASVQQARRGATAMRLRQKQHETPTKIEEIHAGGLAKHEGA